ncbi:MAG: hypothetical protein LKF36_07835 [Lactobacillus sp.]|jgi:hypothetical protein|nr:hypothetical protein [Lactobacillus sp.]
MKRTGHLLLLSMALLALITGCASRAKSNNTTGSSQSTTQGTAATAPLNFSKMYMYADAQRNQRLWIHTKGDNTQIDNKSSVDYLMLTNRGEVTVYTVEDVKLRDFRGLDQREIIKKARDLSEKYFLKRQKEHIEAAQDDIKRMQNSPTKVVGLLDAPVDRVIENDNTYISYIKSIKFSQSFKPATNKLKASVVSDSTGNESMSEKISFTAPRAATEFLPATPMPNRDKLDADYFKYLGSSAPSPSDATYAQTLASHKKAYKLTSDEVMQLGPSTNGLVFKDRYMGYVLFNDDGMWITRTTNPKALIEYDKPTTKGITVKDQ